MKQVLDALDIIGPLDYQEGRDYATIISPAFQMMTVQPDAVLTIFEMWPAALFEINTLKYTLSLARDSLVNYGADQSFINAIEELIK